MPVAEEVNVASRHFVVLPVKYSDVTDRYPVARAGFLVNHMLSVLVDDENVVSAIREAVDSTHDFLNIDIGSQCHARRPMIAIRRATGFFGSSASSSR